jgi:Glycosyl hydrolases family 35
LQRFSDPNCEVSVADHRIFSEFYPGWLDHWSQPFIKVDYTQVVKTMEEMLLINASFNTYMFYGGTNFGFVAGSNQDATFDPIITSYDYDAPISEAGDPTFKFMKIRELLQKVRESYPNSFLDFFISISNFLRSLLIYSTKILNQVFLLSAFSIVNSLFRHVLEALVNAVHPEFLSSQNYLSSK